MDSALRRRMLGLLGMDLARVELGLPLVDGTAYWAVTCAWWRPADDAEAAAR